MRKENLYKLLAIVLGVAFLVMAFVVYSPKKILGGSVHNTQEIFSAGIKTTGTSYINNFIQQGGIDEVSVGASATTGTLTVSDVCNNTLVNVTPLGASATITFPTSDLLKASCLQNIGDVRMLNYMSTATSTVVAAGSGGTLGYTASTTVAAGKYAYIRILRTSATAYLMFLVNIAN